jgi:Pyruvate/2-oxoacid:ferredoxin oxidoreductase gamma subunit
LKDGGVLLINSKQHPLHYAEYCKRFRVFTVDASGIAVAHGLGTRATPIVNTALLGAFMRASALGSIDILLRFIESQMTKKVDVNKQVAMAAYQAVRGIEEEQQ